MTAGPAFAKATVRLALLGQALRRAPRKIKDKAPSIAAVFHAYAQLFLTQTNAHVRSLRCPYTSNPQVLPT
jgi:hypothetical protein